MSNVHVEAAAGGTRIDIQRARLVRALTRRDMRGAHGGGGGSDGGGRLVEGANLVDLERNAHREGGGGGDGGEGDPMAAEVGGPVRLRKARERSNEHPVCITPSCALAD